MLRKTILLSQNLWITKEAAAAPYFAARIFNPLAMTEKTSTRF